jgi:hypothetical protein
MLFPQLSPESEDIWQAKMKILSSYIFSMVYRNSSLDHGYSSTIVLRLERPIYQKFWDWWFSPCSAFSRLRDSCVQLFEAEWHHWDGRAQINSSKTGVCWTSSSDPSGQTFRHLSVKPSRCKPSRMWWVYEDQLSQLYLLNQIWLLISNPEVYQSLGLNHNGMVIDTTHREILVV